MNLKSLFFLLLVFILIVPDVTAIIDITGTNPGPKEYVPPIPNVYSLRKAGLSAQSIKQAMGTTGTQKVAMILVNFSGNGTSSGGNPMTTGNPSDIMYVYDAGLFLKDYYKNASYGKLDLQVTFFWNGGSGTTLGGAETPYQVTNSISYYGSPWPEGDEYGTKVLMQEVLGMCSTVNSSNYDFVVIAHAGYGEESGTGNTGDIWSVNYNLSPAINGFSQCATIPASEDISGTLNSYLYRKTSIRGVLCHEFGHELGLPDLYDPLDTSGNSKRVGNWCVMDSGSWVESNDNEWHAWFPVYPSALLKALLGWIVPVEINTDGNITSYPIETCDNTGIKKSLYSIQIPGHEKEFFLIHTTTQTWTWDTSLAGLCAPDVPGQGFLIWHFDAGEIDSISLHNGSHKMIDLEEADSDDPSVDGGDSTDPWISGSFTSTKSRPYSGAPGCINISNINFIAQTTEDARTTTSISLGYSVSGHVLDSADNNIADAKIDITGDDYGFVYSSQTGHYFVSLSQGNYTLTVSKSGYKFNPEQYSITLSSNSVKSFRAIASSQYDSVSSGDIKFVNNIFNPNENGKVTFWFNTDSAGDINISIFTLSGSTVKTITLSATQGINQIQWDGKNKWEDMVSSGIYLVQIKGAGINYIGKVCIIR